MSIGLVPGVTHTLSLEVNEQLLVMAFTPHFSALADLPPVFATAFMVGFMEWACIEALKPYLLDGENSVGNHVYLSHIAPTSMGVPKEIKVTAQVELVEVKGRTLRFRVDCYDACDLIGSGLHERTVIDTTRFTAKAKDKARVILAKAS